MPLEQAVQQGIVKGYPDGDFWPDAELTFRHFDDLADFVQR